MSSGPALRCRRDTVLLLQVVSAVQMTAQSLRGEHRVQATRVPRTAELSGLAAKVERLDIATSPPPPVTVGADVEPISV